MIYKGTFELEINGVKRGFKTGTLASGYFCEEEKITLKEMMERLTNPTPLTTVNLGYAAARSYCESKKIDIDFTKSDVADWIDDYGLIEFLNKVLESMQSYQDKEKEPKNVITPEK